MDIGDKGVVVCPITKKEEKATLVDIKMLWLLYTPSGAYYIDVRCEGCGQIHRVYNSRFSSKGIVTVRRRC